MTFVSRTKKERISWRNETVNWIKKVENTKDVFFIIGENQKPKKEKFNEIFEFITRVWVAVRTHNL